MLQDWDLKHKALCKGKNAEVRKVKGGSKERFAKGEESLEQAFEKMMSVKNGHKIKAVLDGAKEACEKKEGSKQKKKRRKAKVVVKEAKSVTKHQDEASRSGLGDVD